ncbi:TonB-dependent receptor plug domain-containing protein [Hymenobacter guriensis]|uniref:TonB-dependent receptor plug domain-containing protein n=1 Tax=Hymenobacter guriensis TaxID=2793065 RepID=A0ABS0KYX5_9BACT|nr:TonB-dependent receptor plug domain-containing protein [Hymenobacter guriensis]MBG8553060.1 TonB-dependent receptor plug domain-containing protein [Hymenobacter guriensis]
MTRFLLLGLLACPTLVLAQQTDALESRQVTVQVPQPDSLQNLGIPQTALDGAFICLDLNPSNAHAHLNSCLPLTTVQPLLSRVAGVQVTPYSGAPGAGAVVRIRGAASLDSHVQPLYVIDDVPVFQHQFRTYDENTIPYSLSLNPDASTNPLLSLATEDIAQVEVLKGAFETGQYGSLGQNGVIRINTYRGKAKQSLRVRYTGYGAVQQARTRYQLLGARELAEIANEANLNNNYAPEYSAADLASLGRGTDWQEELLRPAVQYQHHVSLHGGTGFGTRYYASASYLHQTGIALNSRLNGYNLRLNLDQQLGQRLFLSGSLSYGDTRERRLYPFAFQDALRFRPMLPVYTAEGNYAADYELPNPVQQVRQNYSTPHNQRLLTYAQARYQFNRSLLIEVRGSLERDSLTATDYRSREKDYTLQDGIDYGQRSGSYQQWQLNPALCFSHVMAGVHKVQAAAEATAWQNRISQSFYFYDRNRPTTNFSYSSFTYQRRFYSLQLTAGYTYAERYALQASLRADSSPFAPLNEKRQWLPALQGTWQLHNEAFLQQRATISRLEAWAGWGRTSNRANFSGDHGFTYRTANEPFFQFLDELTTQADAGIRLGLWKNSLELYTSVYRRETAVRTGYFGQQQLAYLRNSGLETTLLGNWKKGKMSGTSTVALAFNQNRYHKPASSNALYYRSSTYSSLWENEPVATFIGYRYQGLDASGNPQFEDVTNGTQGPNAQQVLGSGLPRWLLNTTQQVQYKRFGVEMQLDGMFGYQVLDTNLALLDIPANGFNATTRVRDRWTPVHPDAQVPRAGTVRGYFFNSATTYTLQSGNHLRLSNLQLKAEIWQAQQRSISLFVSGTNLLVISKYRGYDPNVSSMEADAKQSGLDTARYPTARVVALGVQATL